LEGDYGGGRGERALMISYAGFCKEKTPLAYIPSLIEDNPFILVYSIRFKKKLDIQKNSATCILSSNTENGNTKQ
jgi:hypothetical protein